MGVGLAAFGRRGARRSPGRGPRPWSGCGCSAALLPGGCCESRGPRGRRSGQRDHPRPAPVYLHAGGGGAGLASAAAAAPERFPRAAAARAGCCLTLRRLSARAPRGPALPPAPERDTGQLPRAPRRGLARPGPRPPRPPLRTALAPGPAGLPAPAGGSGAAKDLGHRQDSPTRLQTKSVGVLGTPVRQPTWNNFHSLRTTFRLF